MDTFLANRRRKGGKGTEQTIPCRPELQQVNKDTSVLMKIDIKGQLPLSAYKRREARSGTTFLPSVIKFTHSFINTCVLSTYHKPASC